MPNYVVINLKNGKNIQTLLDFISELELND